MIKFYRLKDKQARHGYLKEFLLRYITEGLAPRGLETIHKFTIGNHGQNCPDTVTQI